MNKILKSILALKAILLTAGGGYYYYTTKMKPNEKVKLQAKTVEAAKEELPVIPEGNLTVADAVRVREELEILKKDIQNKTIQLAQAKSAYDKAKTDVETKLKKVEDERRILDETLQKEKKVKEDRLKDALEFVGKMEPKKSAPVMATMDRDLVLAMLAKLPPRQVTKILENLDPKKAAEYMEYYTKIRSGREYELMKELGLCQTAPDESENKPNQTGSIAAPGAPVAVAPVTGAGKAN